jgi:signal recognition particle subunit SRP54
VQELKQLRDLVAPQEVLLVADSATGQQAVSVATHFNEALRLTGIILTKLDGDARGGAALSVRAVTGKPILYASTGEKLDELERFHPERMASRILGMGDVMSLIEKAEEVSDEKQAEDLARKMRKQEFTLEDFLSQMKQVRKMGPLSSVLGMMPGMGKTMKQLREVNMDERELDRLEAIILSMTPAERANPQMIDGSRRKRIAQGSGTTIQAVNQLVKQFGQMKKMMARMASGKMPNPAELMKGMR